MKKLFFLASCLIFASCATIVNLDKRMQGLDLGLSKKEAIRTLGDSYVIEVKSASSEGEIEVLRFYTKYGSDYILRFINDRLVEFHRYIPPVRPEVHVINKDENPEKR